MTPNVTCRQPLDDGAHLFGRVLKDIDLHETRVWQQRLGRRPLDEVVERQRETLVVQRTTGGNDLVIDHDVFEDFEDGRFGLQDGT